jgi:hypothetical protein
MKALFSIALFLMITGSVYSQNTDLPYRLLPETPKKYTAGTVAARTVDGLGFRYYWATEGLTEENLAYKANEEGRSIGETLDHIWSLTRITKNSAMEVATTFDVDASALSFEEKRKETLAFIKTTSDILKKSAAKDFAKYDMIFQYPDGNSKTYPFWYQLNGPIDDALWHVGQVVLMRRGAGNPFNSKVSVLSGETSN